MRYYHIVQKTPHLSGKARKYSRGYRKMALVETETPEPPKMISERARGVVRIIACASLYYGTGKRSEGATWLADLKRQKAEIESAA